MISRDPGMFGFAWSQITKTAWNPKPSVVQRRECHLRQILDWQISDLALCVTPASKLENRVVIVVSKPLVDPSKEDVVYSVHTGFCNGDNWE